MNSFQSESIIFDYDESIHYAQNANIIDWIPIYNTSFDVTDDITNATTHDNLLHQTY